jgi:hypothetical protein
MKDTLIKLQIRSLEQQIKVLKSKMNVSKERKTLSDLFGIFEGKMDFTLDEMRKHEYSIKERL